MLDVSVVQLLGLMCVCVCVFFSLVRGVYVLESVPVRQRPGLPQTTGQLHPSVAQPRHGESSVSFQSLIIVDNCSASVVALECRV